MKKIEISDEMYRNFHLFWDNFPFPVLLIHKDRIILDRNKAAEAMGCIPGTRCIDRGKKEEHRGCLANKALQEQAAKRVVAFDENFGRVIDGYWVPLAGEKDIYLHFFADITEYAAEHMFPKKDCREGDHCKSCTGA